MTENFWGANPEYLQVEDIVVSNKFDRPQKKMIDSDFSVELQPERMANRSSLNGFESWQKWNYKYWSRGVFCRH